jgi:hypothetical protein
VVRVQLVDQVGVVEPVRRVVVLVNQFDPLIMAMQVGSLGCVTPK